MCACANHYRAHQAYRLWNTLSEVVPWELGIGVNTKKGVAGRGQGASREGGLSTQEDHRKIGIKE